MASLAQLSLLAQPAGSRPELSLPSPEHSPGPSRRCSKLCLEAQQKVGPADGPEAGLQGSTQLLALREGSTLLLRSWGDAVHDKLILSIVHIRQIKGLCRVLIAHQQR